MVTECPMKVWVHRDRWLSCLTRLWFADWHHGQVHLTRCRRRLHCCARPWQEQAFSLQAVVYIFFLAHTVMTTEAEQLCDS